jgi:2-C-methyl-D-erythritol 4-phosphate cytidylyltransferase
MRPAERTPSSPARHRVAVVVVAAGSGTRFGAANKVTQALRGHPLIWYTIESISAASRVDDIVIVAGEHTYDEIARIVESAGWQKVYRIAHGGFRRQDSVEAGLVALESAAPRIVAVHDGARPLVSPSLIDRVIVRAEEAGAAIAAAKVTDALKRVDQGFVSISVSRDHMWAAQTPQAFDYAELRDAFEQVKRTGHDVLDEASLFELLGKPVAIVESSLDNLKITHASDLALAEAILKTRAGAIA